MNKSAFAWVEGGKARPLAEKEMGEEMRVRWIREGSLQRQFNFGHVCFEVPVSHICSLSLL